MKRVAAIVLALLALAACSRTDEDSKELRSVITRSELRPRTFDYQTIGPNDAFDVRASIQDDFRYEMLLSAGGRQLIAYVVRDDALAVRLLDPTFGGRLANELGHPNVDAALKAGKWVVDPSGAPALFRKEQTGAQVTTADPFADTRGALQAVDDAMAEATAVTEFSLESIEYRPLQDPWKYPDENGGEKRFDLQRPFLPKNEGQASGRGADLSVAQFRKQSVFVRDGRVREVCMTVDIEGHEEIRRLRQEGLDSNPYLANVLRQIQRRETAVPIEPRTSILRVGYPDDVTVDLPKDAVVGKLELFTSALQQAIAAGVLKPSEDERLTDCLREQPTS